MSRSSAVSVESDVTATMRDGALLVADVYRPGEASAPVLVMRTPYGKGVPMDPTAWVDAGFIVVIQDVRGRGGSTGEWRPFHFEGDDGYDTVEWAARLPGSDGNVALVGPSYLGMAALLGAALRPPSLRAVAVSVAGIDPQRGLLGRGGAFELGLQGAWQGGLAADRIARADAAGTPFAQDVVERYRYLMEHLDEAYASRPLADFAEYSKTGLSDFFALALTGHADPESPAVRDPLVDVEAIVVPVLSIGGWYDIYTADTIDLYQRLAAGGIDASLIMGPWAHDLGAGSRVGDVTFPENALFTDDELRRTVFDRQAEWLLQRLRGVESTAPTVSWYTMGSNRWHHADSWPPPSKPYDLFLGADGVLAPAPATEGTVTFTYDPGDPVPTVGGNHLLPPPYTPGPLDQQNVEARADVVCFETADLSNPLTITGSIEVDLWISTTAPSTDFVARLCDVDEQGRSLNIADGIVRIQAIADGDEMSTRAVEISIDLWSMSHTFHAGHRVRLQITSSCSPRWDPNPNTGGDPAIETETVPALQSVFCGADRPSRVRTRVPLDVA